MELEQIRQISIVGFLENLGHMPVSRKGNVVLVQIPLSEMREPHPSRWIRSGMSSFDFCAWEREVIHLPSCGELTGKYRFHGTAGVCFREIRHTCPSGLYRNVRKDAPRFRIRGRESDELSHEALKGYLKERGIDPAIAGRLCKEVAYRIRGNWYFAMRFYEPERRL